MLRDISRTSKERHAHEIVEADHEYEVLDKYNQAYEDIRVPQAPPPKQEQQQSSSAGDRDYELTQCPAYVPVIHGSQETETSLMQPTTVCSTEVAAAAGVKGHGKSGTDDDQKDEDNGTYETVHPY